MHFDTDGVYTLLYTAEDSCGNETIEERTVEVVSLRTVIYTDNTMIFNEKSTDQATNEAEHGTAKAVYDPMLPDGSNYVFPDLASVPWMRYRPVTVKFGSEMKPTSMAHWFHGQTKLQTFDGTNLDISNVVSYVDAFRNCSVLTPLDVSGFVTSNTTDISGMFANSYELTALAVSDWDTSNVTNMSDVFLGCSKLTAIDVSEWDVSNVTDMSGMFDSCYRLSQIDVTQWDTSNATAMSRLFRQCQSLTTLDLSSWDTSNVTNMSDMFAGTNSRNVYLQTIYVSAQFVTDAVVESNSMFLYCTNALMGGAGTRWNINNPQDKTYAHIDGGTADPGYFTAKP